jgi:hypothetical protein
MTAILGYLFEDGVFVTADTRRIFEVNTNKYNEQVNEKFEKIITRKIHKLTDRAGIAIAGNASEFGPIQELQWLIKNSMDKDEIKALINRVYKKYDNKYILNDMLLFGIDNGNSFMVHIDEYQNMRELNYTSIKGIPEPSFEQIAKEKVTLATYNGKVRLDVWAQISFNEIIKNALPIKADQFKDIEDPEMIRSSVSYPIDMVILRNDGNGFIWKGIDTQFDSNDIIQQFQIGLDVGLSDEDDELFTIE